MPSNKKKSNSVSSASQKKVNVQSAQENKNNDKSLPLTEKETSRHSKKWKRLIFGGISTLIVLCVGFFTLENAKIPYVSGSNIDLISKTIPWNAPIHITFSTAMNHAETEKAFSITPNISGRFEWNSSTMMFIPDKAFTIGDHYAVVISQKASNLFGKTLDKEAYFEFTIGGAPEVAFVSPRDITAPADTSLVVMFNQPMISLSTLDEQKDNNINLQISPNIHGDIRWIDTSSFEFKPRDRFTFSTDYTVTLPQGTKSENGGSMEKDFTFQFSTPKPLLNDWTTSNSGDLGPNSKILLTWNQPMDEKELTNKIIFKEGNQVRSLSDLFSISTDPKDNNITLLTPKKNLPLKTKYSFSIPAGIKGKEGNAVSAQEKSIELTTVGYPERYKATIKSPEGKEMEVVVPVDMQNFPVEFTNSMLLQSFKDHISIDPAVEGFTYDDSGIDSRQLNFQGNFEYSREYTLTIKKGVKDVFGMTTQQDIVVKGKTGDRSPFVRIDKNGSESFLNGYMPQGFSFKTVNTKSLKAELCQLSLSAYLERQFVYTEVSPKNCVFQKNWNIETKVEKNKLYGNFIDLTQVMEKTPEPGFYFLKLEDPSIQNEWERQDLVSFHISKSALSMKVDKEKLMIWATDLASGQPISNMNIDIYTSASKILASGKTDAKGIFTTPFNFEGAVFALGSREGDTSLVSRWWSNGIGAWEFGYGNDYQKNTPFAAYTYTERPIYRPEQEVFFKGIVRVDQDIKYVLPPKRNVQVIIQDAQGKELMRSDIALSDMGTFGGKLLLGSAAALGQYNLITKIGEQEFYSNFFVEEYRKPAFQVDITTDDTSYVNGDELTATVAGSYLFGGKLQGNTVDWSLRSTDYYFSEYEGEWYSFSDNDSFWYCFESCAQKDDFIATGSGTLDQDGNFKLQTPLSLKDKKVNQLYTFEAVIQGQNDQSVASRTSFPVFLSDYLVGVRADSYAFEQNQKGKFEALVLTTDKKPVSNESVEFTLLERKWNQVQKKNIDEEFYPVYEPEDTEIKTLSSRTDANGKATVEFDLAKAGNIVIKAKVQDSKKRSVQSSTSFFVSNTYEFISWYSANNSRIQLVPDKQFYNAGETAKVLIPAPFSNAKALITYEKRNILYTDVIDIKNTSHTLEIPIKAEYIPNVYISVLLFKGMQNWELYKSSVDTLRKQHGYIPGTPGQTDPAMLLSTHPGVPEFRAGYVNLKVNHQEKTLQVSLKPDKSIYLPGEKVELTIETKDSTGKGVPAETSLAVVDQGIYLLKNREDDIVKFFYDTKYLGVETASSMTIFSDMFRVNPGGAKGGGGGLEEKPRGNFKDTAFWQENIKTDAQGKATLSFTLPDNLTTWNMVALAVDNDTRVGVSKYQVKTSKSLMITPILPRFVRSEDTISFGATVYNGSDTAQSGDIRITVPDTMVKLEEKDSFSFRIKPQSEQRFIWNATLSAFSEPQSLKINMKAENNAAKDEINLSLPVLLSTTPETVATYGESEGTSKTEILHVPTQENIQNEHLSIKVFSNVFSPLKDQLQQFLQYPYGCTEQIISAMMSLVLTKNLYENLNMNLPSLEIPEYITNSLFDDKVRQEKDPKKKIDLAISTNLQKMYKTQRSNGGWGYWEGENSYEYPYLTAHVVLGLSMLQESGYSIDANVLSKGISFLNNHIRTHSIYEALIGSENNNSSQQPDEPGSGAFIDPKIDLVKANERAFILYVLSQVSQADQGMTNNLYDNRNAISHYAKAYLLMTLSEFNDVNRTQTLMREIEQLVSQDVNARTAYIQEEQQDFINMGSNARSSAVILQALLSENKDHPLALKLLRGLLEKVNTSYGTNTQENVHMLTALSLYARLHPSSLNQNINVLFDTVSLGEVILNKDTHEKILEKDLSNEASNRHEITFNKSQNEGVFWYDMVLSYIRNVQDIEPQNRGIGISRTYQKFQAEKGDEQNFKIGDVVEGNLKIIIPTDRYHVAIESPLPAGFELINFNLDTESQSLENNLQNAGQDENIKQDGTYHDNGLWRFNHQEMRDDRLLLFAEYLPAGVYDYKYLVRITSVGSFRNPPAFAYLMYFPEIFGRSRGEIIHIK